MERYAYIIKIIHHFITELLYNERSDPDFRYYCQLLDMINFLSH